MGPKVVEFPMSGGGYKVVLWGEPMVFLACAQGVANFSSVRSRCAAYRSMVARAFPSDNVLVLVEWVSAFVFCCLRRGGRGWLRGFCDDFFVNGCSDDDSIGDVQNKDFFNKEVFR